MTRSNDRSLALDLERGLPTTAEDVAALRRVRQLAPLDLAGYLQFLASLPEVTCERLRKKRGPAGDEPFELSG